MALNFFEARRSFSPEASRSSAALDHRVLHLDHVAPGRPLRLVRRLALGLAQAMPDEEMQRDTGNEGDRKQDGKRKERKGHGGKTGKDQENHPDRRAPERIEFVHGL